MRRYACVRNAADQREERPDSREKLERGLERRTAEVWSAERWTVGNRRGERGDRERDSVERDLRRRRRLQARARAEPLADRARRVGQALLTGRDRGDVLRSREQRHVAGEQAVQVDEVHEQRQQQVWQECRDQCPAPPREAGKRNQDTPIVTDR